MNMSLSRLSRLNLSRTRAAKRTRGDAGRPGLAGPRRTDIQGNRRWLQGNTGGNATTGMNHTTESGAKTTDIQGGGGWHLQKRGGDTGVPDLAVPDLAVPDLAADKLKIGMNRQQGGRGWLPLRRGGETDQPDIRYRAGPESRTLTINCQTSRIATQWGVKSDRG
mmetsp:Transcript_76151/g.132064  ORF Transcript_76151/g.132064 Transcript_76151/m.132064 type:complete len:165 (+) Transcript_76151:991-1485(+)